MPIIITKNGKGAIKTDKSGFPYEENLQKFIYDNPDTVPLYEIDENIQLLILAKEFQTNSGPIDALGIDEKGEIYLIETKLYKNPDKRLVVAQVLDYGAALSSNISDKNDFFQILESKVNQHFKQSLSQKLSEFFGYSSDEVTELLDSITANLYSGKFKFVVLMDKLGTRLRDLILFLNRNARFDIYGVELEFYKYEDFEITIPKLYGSEVIKELDTPSSSNRRKWDEKSFFEQAQDNLNDERSIIIKELYESSKNNADEISWGTGVTRGSFNPIFKKICPRSLFTVFSDGTIQLNYAWINKTDQEKIYQEKYKELLNVFFELPPDDGTAKYPTIQIEILKGKLDEFIEGIVELIED
jgi:hypothetical protein